MSSTNKDDDDDLNDIVVSQEDWFQVNPINFYDQTIVDRLVKKMCETPVAVVYENCFNFTSNSISQENMISVKKKQYYAIYPKYLIESSLVTLQVSLVCDR